MFLLPFYLHDSALRALRSAFDDSANEQDDTADEEVFVQRQLLCMILAGITFGEPYLQHLVFKLIIFQFKKLQSKAKLRVPKSRSLYMIADFTNSLPPNHIYCHVNPGPDADEEGGVLKGRVLLMRSPCYHPSSVVLPVAVGAHPLLSHMQDVVVVSTQGHPPLAEVLTGDFDGDYVFVSWDDCLIYKNAPLADTRAGSLATPGSPLETSERHDSTQSPGLVWSGEKDGVLLDLLEPTHVPCHPRSTAGIVDVATLFHSIGTCSISELLGVKGTQQKDLQIAKLETAAAPSACQNGENAVATGQASARSAITPDRYVLDDRYVYALNCALAEYFLQFARSNQLGKIANTWQAFIDLNGQVPFNTCKCTFVKS